MKQKISNETAGKIKTLRDQGFTFSDIAKKLGVSIPTARRYGKSEVSVSEMPVPEQTLINPSDTGVASVEVIVNGCLITGPLPGVLRLLARFR